MVKVNLIELLVRTLVSKSEYSIVCNTEGALLLYDRATVFHNPFGISFFIVLISI